MEIKPDINPVIARRTALAAGLAGAGTLALAACGTGSSAASAAKNTPQSAGGTPIAKIDDIKVGESLDAELNGKPVLVSRPTPNTAACFSAICTHQGCTVKADGAKLACPCHGSVFDAKTGAVLAGPAPAPLVKVPVTVEKGQIVTS